MLERWNRKQKQVLAYRAVFASEDGKAVLHDLARRHGVLASVYAIGRPQDDGLARALEMAHADGERNVVLGIIRLLNIDLADLLREAQEEELRARSSDRSDYADPAS